MPATAAPKLPPPPSGWTNVVSVTHRRHCRGTPRRHRRCPSASRSGCSSPTDATAEPKPRSSCGLAIDNVAGRSCRRRDRRPRHRCVRADHQGRADDQVGSQPADGRAEPCAQLRVRVRDRATGRRNSAASCRPRTRRPRPRRRPCREHRSRYWCRSCPPTRRTVRRPGHRARGCRGSPAGCRRSCCRHWRRRRTPLPSPVPDASCRGPDHQLVADHRERCAEFIARRGIRVGERVDERAVSIGRRDAVVGGNAVVEVDRAGAAVHVVRRSPRCRRPRRPTHQTRCPARNVV